jgi:hypothetical protein
MAQQSSGEFDEGEAALFRVGLVEDEGVDLAAQRIEAEAARPVDEEGEFVVGRVARDRAPDDGEVARVIERGVARDRDKLGAGGWRAPAPINRASTLEERARATTALLAARGWEFRRWRSKWPPRPRTVFAHWRASAGTLGLTSNWPRKRPSFNARRIGGNSNPSPT